MVDNYPGLTRDLRKKNIMLWDKELQIIDSPGLVLSKKKFEKKINEFTLNNAKLCDLILIVFDAKSELSSEDLNVITLTRKLNKNTLLIYNKSDKKNLANHNLKVSWAIFVSATHNSGIDELNEFIIILIKN